MSPLLTALSFLAPRPRYLIGVSGGRDSVALLHALHSLGFKALIVCHLNHRLRGRASTQDAAFVQALAQCLGYECHVEVADVKALAQVQKQSIEATARQARHQFFARIARQRRCPRLLLAHHAEDQAETVLMRALRGTGIGGLAGMSRDTSLSIPNGKRPATELQLIRPLLSIRGADIAAYVAEHRLKFREDASNADSAYTRNALRHEALPMLANLLGRDPAPMLVRLARVAEREDAWMQHLTEQFIAKAALLADDGALLLKPELLAADPALQHRVLHHWLKAQAIPSLTQELVEQAVQLITQPTPARINLPKARQLRRKAGKCFLTQQ